MENPATEIFATAGEKQATVPDLDVRHAHESVPNTRQALKRHFDFYNRKRSHSTLGGKPPDMAYFNQQQQTIAA